MFLKFMIVSLLVIGLAFTNESELIKVEVTNEKLSSYGAIVCGAEICTDNQVKLMIFDTFT